MCSEVFDGVANLLTEEAVAALPNDPSPQMGLFDSRESAAAPDGPGEIAAADIVTPHARLPESKPAAIAQSIAGTTAEAADQASTPHLRAPDHAPCAPRAPPQPEPAFLRSRQRTAYTFTWTLLSLITLVALAGQVALHLRTEIAVLVPQARAYIETACESLGCDLRLPRRAELMSIESSDLQADTQRPGVIVLNALLRNRAPFEQEYPDLELTLTDERDQAVIRRVLKPGDYLQDKRVAVTQGIAAGSEEAVRIYLDTSRIRATGYRLFLFYR